MPIATTSTKESLAQRYTELCTHASAHTADPGTTGASEVTGGSPAYARKPITWNAGAEDGVYTSNPVTIDIPAATTITHIGLWSALTAGTFRDKVAFSITFASQGTVTFTLTYTQS